MDTIDQLRLSLTRSLLQTGRHWQHLAQNAMGTYGISPSGATALLFIGRLGEGVRQIELAKEIGIEGASLVRVIDQLEAAGLLRREESSTDRRAKTLWFTEAGRALTLRVEAVLVDLRARVLADIDAADLDATLRVFKAIERAAQQGVPPAADTGRPG